MSNVDQSLIDKIRSLPPDKIDEVADFVDFLYQRHSLTLAAAKLSEDAFRKVWDNPDDSAYDQL